MLVEVGYNGLHGEDGLEPPSLPLLSHPHCQQLSLALERGPGGQEGLPTLSQLMDSWSPFPPPSKRAKEYQVKSSW